MKTLKQKNLTLLQKYYPTLCKNMKDGDENIEVINSSKGDPIPLIKKEGKILLLHSKFDPKKEAQRLIGEIDNNHNLFIIMGFGFAYHIETLQDKLPKNSAILVLEKDYHIINKAIASRDLTAIFEDKRIILLIDPNEDTIANALKGKSSKTVSFITHRGSHQVYPEYYSNLLKIAKSYLSTKEVNIATLAKFEKIWSANIARNIAELMHNPGVNIFYDTCKNIPAIVVAAGPSLSKSISFIEKHKKNAIIICVDTAYKLLIKNNIIPHFCVAVDPQVINARYFEGILNTDTILVSDPTVHPSVFNFFKGRKIIAGVAFELMKWIENIIGEKGDLTHGGSVSTDAYDFAKRLGASPVIMVGQDLSFTEGYAHAKGSYLDEQIHMKTDRLFNSEMFNRKQLTALPKIFVKGISNNKVHTNQKMMIFLSWFEKRKDPHLINATKTGAYINGIKHKNANEIRLGSLDIDLQNTINSIYDESNSIKNMDKIQDTLTHTINSMLKELAELSPILKRAVEISKNLIAQFEKPKPDRNKVQYIFNKLNETDKIIESSDKIKNIISLTTQKVIHTITEGHEIDDNDLGLSEELLVAKRSHYLYTGLYDSIEFNQKILKKMLHFIS